MGTCLKLAVRDWINASALWRWRALTLTGRYPEAPDALWVALAREAEALHYEADEIATALEDQAKVVSSRRSKIFLGLAGLVRADQAAIDANTQIDGRAFGRAAGGGGTGMGGLKGWWTSPMAWGEVGSAFKKILIALGIVGAVGAGVGIGYTTYRVFLRSPADRAQEEIEVLRQIQSSRAADLARCASDPNPEECREQVNETYKAMSPQSCGDVLDTPLGSSLGLLVGAGAGYVGMRKIMGWT